MTWVDMLFARFSHLLSASSSSLVEVGLVLLFSLNWESLYETGFSYGGMWKRLENPKGHVDATCYIKPPNPGLEAC